MVMVQTEESAKFDGMPNRAISTGMADFILPPADMPQQLLSFIKHPYTVKANKGESHLSEEDDISKIFSVLREKTKIDFSHYKPNTVIRRIERRMSICQLYSLHEYVKYLEENPQESVYLFRDLLIGVTNFFRDPEAYEALRRHLREVLISSPKNEIRIWVAGCSSGEEAYSIAILVSDILEREGIRKSFKIFATDIDRDALMNASNGIYPESIIADVPTDYLHRYFKAIEENYQINRNIREQIVFANHNIIKDPPFTNLDLITCRNLLIYLQPGPQKKIFDHFNFSLNANGLLFWGSSESIGDMSEYFETLEPKLKIFRSTGKRKLNHISDSDTTSVVEIRRRSQELQTRASYIRVHDEEERLLDRFLQMASSDYLPATIIVNEQMEILHIFGEDIKLFFSIPMGKMHNDITKMAPKELSIPLATGILKAFQKQQEVSFSNIRLETEAGKVNINLRVKKLPEKRGQEALVAIFLEKIENIQTKETSENILHYDIDKEAQQRIIDLEQDLQFNKESLQATIEELETSNEELLATNEELQSTNEELQSVNEELYTVNAEHQSKIMELTELNNDLNNLMTAIPTATIFLDEQLRIRRYTTAATQIFHIRETDLGRYLEEISNNLVDIDLIDIIKKVHTSFQTHEMHVQNKQLNWYVLRIAPYEVGPKSFLGLVVTLHNITELKNNQIEMDRYRERINLSQSIAHLGFWDWDIPGHRLFWSSNTEALFGMEPGTFQGNYSAF